MDNLLESAYDDRFFFSRASIRFEIVGANNARLAVARHLRRISCRFVRLPFLKPICKVCSKQSVKTIAYKAHFQSQTFSIVRLYKDEEEINISR